MESSATQRSWVAEYFLVSEDRKFAKCLLCLSQNKAKGSEPRQFQTSNLAYHLRSAHSISPPSQDSSGSTTSSSTQRNLPGIWKELSDAAEEKKLHFALLMATLKMPYSWLRGAHFRRVTGVNFAERTMKKEVKRLGAAVHRDVQKAVGDCAAATLLCDSTQSDNSSGSWLNFMVAAGGRAYYWKGMLWQASMTGASIAVLLKEVVDEIETTGKVVVVAICSDNGTNFVAGIQQYMQAHRPWMWFVRCTAHSLQLVVKDAIQETAPELKSSLSQAIAPFRQSEVQRQFESAQKMSIPPQRVLRLVKPVEVRWNSWYNCARRILDRWSAFVSAIISTPNGEEFASAEWKHSLESFCTAMEPLAIATVQAQRDDFSATDYFTLLEKTMSSVDTIGRNAADPLVRSWCTAVISSYTRRWGINFNNGHVAGLLMFLDPQQKASNNMTVLNPVVRQAFLDFCVGFVSRRATSVLAPGALYTAFEAELGQYGCGMGLFEGISTTGGARQYWFIASGRGCRIAECVLAMLQIACCQAAAERSFSVQGYQVDDRPRISFSLLEAEMQLKMNAALVWPEVLELAHSDTSRKRARTTDDDSDESSLTSDSSDPSEGDAGDRP